MVRLGDAALILQLALVAAPAAVQACGALPSNLEVEDSQFEKRAKVIGRYQSLGPSPSMSACDPNVAALRSWVDKKTGKVEHQIYVIIMHKDDWNHWTTAADDGANSLPLVEVLAKVVTCVSDPCLIMENVVVDVTDKYLRKKAKSGLAVQISGQSGRKMVIDLPAALVAEQLAAVDAYKAEKGLK